MAQGVQIDRGVSVVAPVRVEAPVVRRPVFRLDQPIIITIDGPAGTGKSSVARMLAARLGLDFLDTGAMYRAAAMVSLRRGIPISHVDALVAAAIDADIHFDWDADPPDVIVEGAPAGEALRTREVTGIVSRVAGIGALRRHMVQRQREIAHWHPRLVTEGRDQGSVVFPGAHVKFYLDASPEVRAARRARQLLESGQPADEARLLEEIILRDASDMGRADGPLVKPPGGTVVDTSGLEFDQVVEALERLVREKANEP